MQDAFLKLWERWDRIERIADPRAYLFRMALNGSRRRARTALQPARRADGSNVRQVTGPDEPQGALDLGGWAPDGGSIVFSTPDLSITTRPCPSI